MTNPRGKRAGFVLPVADVDDIRLLYATPLSLLTDLRAAGEANAIRQWARSNPSRALFPVALARLPCEGGRAAVSLRMAVMTGWTPG